MTKKVLILLLALFLAVPPLIAQDKSAGKAILLSAFIPGAGEMYLGNYRRAGIFMGAELLIILSYARLNNEIKWKTNSYKLYAENFADISLDSDDSYYRFISNYISSDAYNADIEMFYRNRYIVYEYNPEAYNLYRDRFLVAGEEEWEWESTEHWLEYRSIRRDKQRIEILANFALGASVLNRIISIIDTAIISRSIRKDQVKDSQLGYDVETGNSILSGIYFEPDLKNHGIRLNYEFSF